MSPNLIVKLTDPENRDATPTIGVSGAAAGEGAKPQIPDHLLVRCIGSGSYGKVWLARSVTGTMRAIKVVYRSTFSDERPYEREFSGIQKYEPISRSHEGMVDILHVGRHDAAGYFYYVMELADDASAQPRLSEGAEARAAVDAHLSDRSGIRPGTSQPGGDDFNADAYVPKTLSQELKHRRRLPPETCIRLGISLASALSHLHQSGLIHRDIKPSNIVFVNDVPKLADIGLVSETRESMTFVGTEGYIPPEGPGSPAADIYGLGKVLYQMVTGKDRNDYPELPTDLDEMEDRMGLVRFMDVVALACEPELRKRCKSAKQLGLALHSLENRGKSLSPVTGARRSVPSLLASNWQMVAGAAFAVVLLVLALVSFRNDGKKIGTPPRTGQLPTSAASPNIAELPGGEVLKVVYEGSVPAVPAGAGKARLQLAIFARREAENKFNSLEDGGKLRSGADGYRIRARPLTAGYLYVFQIDSSGKIDWLFPSDASAAHSRGSNPVAPLQLITLPSTEEAYNLDQITGVEHLYAVFSAVRWPELETVLIESGLRQQKASLVAARVEKPNDLRLRGVSGIHTDPGAASLIQALENPQSLQQDSLEAPVFESTESFMVIERWFNHLE